MPYETFEDNPWVGYETGDMRSGLTFFVTDDDPKSPTYGKKIPVLGAPGTAYRAPRQVFEDFNGLKVPYTVEQRIIRTPQGPQLINRKAVDPAFIPKMRPEQLPELRKLLGLSDKPSAGTFGPWESGTHNIPMTPQLWEELSKKSSDVPTMKERYFQKKEAAVQMDPMEISVKKPKRRKRGNAVQAAARMQQRRQAAPGGRKMTPKELAEFYNKELGFTKVVDEIEGTDVLRMIDDMK